jgi:hypothetical protein
MPIDETHAIAWLLSAAGDNRFGETSRTKEINKQNRPLDRALRGICRGC